MKLVSCSMKDGRTNTQKSALDFFDILRLMRPPSHRPQLVLKKEMPIGLG